MNRPRKYLRILRVLVERGERGLNRFEAAAQGDSVLPQTVAKIETATGLHIERKLEAVPGWCGSTAHCARYWLNQESTKRALEFLSGVAS